VEGIFADGAGYGTDFHDSAAQKTLRFLSGNPKDGGGEMESGIAVDAFIVGAERFRLRLSVLPDHRSQ
jgi:hypothetical protein